jgi:D-glycero-D-manno-heptose 1,7-bisphosphate phosphatase
MAEPTADPAPDFGGRLVEPGLWVEVTGRTDWRPGKPALFLDRDGTINVDTDYPSHRDQIVLRDEIVEIVRAGNEAEIPVVVVTNQSGIARGYFGWSEFAAVNARVLELLGARGCSVDLVIACAYHESGQGALAIPDHPMRKPNPGMLLLGRDRLRLDLTRSIMVGDKPADMEAARRAGLAEGWLVGGGFARVPGFAVKALNTEADRLVLVRSIAG